MMRAIRHIYISPGHNCLGHHGGPPGDRYFGEKEDYKGQITFFALEVHRQLCEKFGKPGSPPSVYRRNSITEGLDLTALIGREFELHGIRFLGTEECKPCYWMETKPSRPALKMQ